MKTGLRIQLLGDIQITIDGREIGRFPSRASEAVLAYVAMHERPVAREHLISLLWEYSDPKQAGANLRSALSSLRKAVGNHLVVTRYQVSLNLDNVYIDAIDFATQMRLAASLEIAEVEEALAAYRGDFLTGFHIRDGREFEEWALIQRERLQQLAVVGLRRIVQAKLQTAEYQAGIELAERWLSIDPYSEEAYRQLMWLYMRNGQRVAALRTYQRCETILLNDIGVPPARSTATLHYRLQQLNSPPPNNVPENITPFVGRQQEVEQLRTALVEHKQRLITLLGAGGMGKTRLAMAIGQQIVATHRGAFLDGVFFVPLANVTDVEQVTYAIAAAVGIELQGGDSAETNLIEALSNKELLLILDNLEQLLVTNTLHDLLSRIIQACPDVYILATSRERLNLYEEVVQDVGGLPLPPNQLVADADYPAIELFVRTAQRIRNDFSADTPDNQAIANITRLVDGAPLAIELAASLVRQTNVSDIASNLAKTLPQIESNLHNIPERQRSLRAVFDHSWVLLTAKQQRHFAALSIFPDSFTTDAALAIVGLSLNQLFDLQDKSLVATRGDGRHQLHPLLKEFSAEKLTTQDDHAEKLRQTHATYFCQWVKSIEETHSEEERSRQLLPEFANVRAAWLWYSRNQAIDLLAELLNPLFDHFLRTHRYADCIQTFQVTLDNLTATNSEVAILRGRLLNGQGRALVQSGIVAKAADKFQEAITLFEQHNAPVHLARALAQLAMTKVRSGDYEDASKLVQQSLVLAQRNEEGGLIALCNNLLGSIHKSLGKLEAAAGYFQQGLEVRRALADQIGIAMVLNNLGNLALEQEAFEQAFAYFEQAKDIFVQESYAPGEAAAIANAALAAHKAGRFEQVKTLTERSLAIRRAIPDPRGITLALIQLASIELDLNNTKAAQEALEEAIQTVLSIDDQSLVIDVVAAVANWYHRQMRWSRAKALLTNLQQRDSVRFDAQKRIDSLWHSLPDDIELSEFVEFSADFPHLASLLN